MGMGAYLLGGALQGAGQGMALRQKVADEERRDAALSALRRGEIEMQYQKAGENQAAGISMKAQVDREDREDDQKFKSQMASAGAQADDRREKDRRQHEINMKRLDQGFQASESQKARAAEREAEWGKPIDSFIDEQSGDVTFVYRGNKTEKYPGIARKQPKAATSGSLFADEAAPDPVATKPKIATRAQLQEMAKATGKSVEEAESWARGQGWQIR